MKKRAAVRRTYRTETEIRALLIKQEKEDIKVGDFCLAHNISRATFYNWRHQYGFTSRQPAFVAVQLPIEPDANPGPRLFAEIQLSGARTIRIFHQVDPNYLKSLVQP